MQTNNKIQLIELATADFDPSLVYLNEDQIARFELPGTPTTSNFTYMVDPEWRLIEMVAFWIYCSAQAFRFWELGADNQLKKYHYAGMTGSTAMFSCIREHWVDGIFPHEMTSVFTGAPDATNRKLIALELSLQREKLYEVAGALIAKGRAGQLSVADAAYLADAFPKSFNDPYLKKAQLAISAAGGLVTEIMGVNLEYDLTAFADYQVPRVLRALGIIGYSPELASMVDGSILIPAGSNLERSLRSATIVAVERLSIQAGVPAVIIDNFLWQNQDLAKGDYFHLTETTAY